MMSVEGTFRKLNRMFLFVIAIVDQTTAIEESSPITRVLSMYFELLSSWMQDGRDMMSWQRHVSNMGYDNYEVEKLANEVFEVLC